MKELVVQFEDQLKKLSKDDKDLLVAQLLQKKKQSREKAKNIAAKKRAAGIKPISIELSADQAKEFKLLLAETGLTKSDLLMEMLNCYKAQTGSKAV